MNSVSVPATDNHLVLVGSLKKRSICKDQWRRNQEKAPRGSKRAPQGKPMKRKIGAQGPVKRPKEPVQQH